MELQARINRQRVKHIVQSYQLDRGETDQFAQHLHHLFREYPTPLIELALVETLVEHWSLPPFPKGLAFLDQCRQKLKAWQTRPVISSISPSQFQQITGLDPQPVFGAQECTSPYSPPFRA